MILKIQEMSRETREAKYWRCISGCLGESGEDEAMPVDPWERGRSADLRSALGCTMSSSLFFFYRYIIFVGETFQISNQYVLVFRHGIIMFPPHFKSDSQPESEYQQLNNKHTET